MNLPRKGAAAAALCAGGTLLALPAGPEARTDAPVKAFGKRGIARLGAGTRLTAVAVQRDGRIVVVGQQGSRTKLRLVLARLTATGRPDRTFNRGRVILGPVGSAGEAVSIGRDGHIAVAGTLQKGRAVVALLAGRFTAAGRPDRGFSGDGFASFGTSAEGRAVLAMRDGSVVVGGAALATTDTRAVLVRFTARGALDRAVSGVKELGANSQINALASGPGGTFLVAGSSRPDLRVTDALVARLTARGALDPGFGRGGVAIRQLARTGAAYSSLNGLAVQRDGKVLAAGSATRLSRSPGLVAAEAVAVRFTRNGAVDGSFAGGIARASAAKAALLPQGVFPGATSVALTRSGALAAPGSFLDSGSQSLALFGFTRGGGARATQRTSLGRGTSGQATGIATAPDGTLVVVGGQTSVFSRKSFGVVLRYRGF